MVVRYEHLVAFYTVFSASAVAWRINSLQEIALLPGFFFGATRIFDHDNAELSKNFLPSPLNLALFGNFVASLMMLAALFAKTLFFGQLSLLETQKFLERLISYSLFKVLFFTWVVQPDTMHIALWLGWFTVLGFMKVFQGLAKDRLELLNTSPTATMLAHVRAFLVLVVVLLSDFFWIQLFILRFTSFGLSTFLLLLFEPISIALETIQAVIIHGIQLFETWQQNRMDVSQYTGVLPSERSAAGAAKEWRGAIIRNCSFVMDLGSLFLKLIHYLHIWWIRGLGLQLVDGILFLNLRAMLSAILRRIKAFLRQRTAMGTLQGALPDATKEELLAYDDDCAICKEPMARAKRLPCAHLFHLPCLRSWLDHGLAETYSCPTCRRPLFTDSARMGSSSLQAEHPSTGRDNMRGALNRNAGTDGQTQQNFHRRVWNLGVDNHWRSNEFDPSWPTALQAGTIEGDSSLPETTRGFARIQLMMRRFTGGRSFAHGQVDEGSWRWWPFSSNVGESSSGSPSLAGRQRQETSSLHHRTNFTGSNRTSPNATNRADLNMAAMFSMVREVLPHIPDEIIIEDLQRTNSVTATVNNLL